MHHPKTNMQNVCKYRMAKSLKTHGILSLIGHFLQKSPIISGSFAKNDLQLKASQGASPCTSKLHLEMSRSPIAAQHCNKLINTLQQAATQCTTLTHTALRCTTLHCTAPRCTKLHHAAAALHCTTPYYTLQHTAPYCSTFQHTPAHSSTLKHHLQMPRGDESLPCCCAPHCTTLQHTATHCTTLQHTAPHCTTLHHTAPHCRILHHTATKCSTRHHSAAYNTSTYPQMPLQDESRSLCCAVLQCVS